MNKGLGLTLLLLACFIGTGAKATPDESRDAADTAAALQSEVLANKDHFNEWSPPNEEGKSYTGFLIIPEFSKPSEIFERTLAVFKRLGIPDELDYTPELQVHNRQQTEDRLNKFLAAFDPKSQYRRFSVIEGGSSHSILHSFQDFDSKTHRDFDIELAPPGTDVSLTGLPSWNPPGPSQLPLRGLRIALDPGHMGGDFWDNETGKYVKPKSGPKLSEGVLNLQVALLLKDRFEKLGASVLITRNTLGPVTSLKLQDLDIITYARDRIRSETLEPWFLNLVTTHPVGPTLDTAVDQNPTIKKYFSNFYRSDYFILRADLNARAAMIKRFQPHITLVIHFDTNNSSEADIGLSPTRVEFTKAYVAGAFTGSEFSSREQRKDFAHHILNPREWLSSLQLSKQIVQAMKQKLGLMGDPGSGGVVVHLDDGIFARNLSLTRTIYGSALSYVECLFYNDPDEYQKLIQKDFSMNIGGETTFYSQRLVEVVDGLETGVLSYLRTTFVSLP